MSVIASTGAMLLSGHKKQQWEVGLSLPNVILVTRWHSRVARYKFLVPVIVPKARSNASIGLLVTSWKGLRRFKTSAKILTVRCGWCEAPAVFSDAPLCHVNDLAAKCFGKSDGIPISPVNSLLADGNGGFWLGGQTALVRWHAGVSETYPVKALTKNVGQEAPKSCTVGVRSNRFDVAHQRL